jgi:phosphoribosyl 1,2-cyclic phosphodiesterase
VLTFSLQSGSNGNAVFVEAGGVRLLFDAGISGETADRRMAAHGRDIRQADALIISHDHTDHIRCAGIYQRKFGLPIYITPATQRATWCSLGRLSDVRHFRSGDVLTFGEVRVHTLPTAHDAADGVAFVVEHEGRRLGILTDLGHPFPGLREILETVHGAYLESNYDGDMLENGSYPWELKQRIRGGSGHLSNDQAADLLRACGRRLPQWVAVAHLSADNNHPDLAVGAQHAAVGRSYPVHHASRYEPSPIFEV